MVTDQHHHFRVHPLGSMSRTKQYRAGLIPVVSCRIVSGHFGHLANKLLLGFVHDAVHHHHRFDGVVTDRGFAGEHTGISTIENRVRHVGDFGSSGLL